MARTRQDDRFCDQGLGAQFGGKTSDPGLHKTACNGQSVLESPILGVYIAIIKYWLQCLQQRRQGQGAQRARCCRR